MRKSILGILSLWIWAFTVHAAPLTATSAQPSAVAKPGHTAPFTPQLVTNKAPVCADLVPDVQKAFMSDSSLGASEYDIPNISFYALKSVPEPDMSKALVQPDGTRLYIHDLTLPGCGGGCEGDAVLVSDQPLTKDTAESAPGVSETPGRGPWGLYQDAQGTYYLEGIVDDQVQVIRLAPAKQWQTTCAISLSPGDLSKSQDAAVRAAAAAVQGLIDAASKMAGDGRGDCGTMATSGRWTSDLAGELRETVYRPWAVKVPAGADHSSENSYGDYSRIAEALSEWSVGGIYEFHTYQSYQARMHDAAVALSALYQADFGWDKARSDSMAESGLENGISYGFGFYMYSGPPQVGYRQPILQHEPLAVLESAPLEDLQGTTPGSDPLLSVAVENPEALQLLLKKGLEPNARNDFGKTPLMYAAQYNQLESARLLLEGGADPNAVTTQAADQCNYAVGVTNVTALDYAIRYSTTAMVKLLLAHGATTSISSTGYGEVTGKPLDWLHKYTAAGDERNPNIQAANVPELEQLLQAQATVKPQQHE